MSTILPAILTATQSMEIALVGFGRSGFGSSGYTSACPALKELVEYWEDYLVA